MLRMQVTSTATGAPSTGRDSTREEYHIDASVLYDEETNPLTGMKSFRKQTTGAMQRSRMRHAMQKSAGMPRFFIKSQ